jgi:hypothetical protein
MWANQLSGKGTNGPLPSPFAAADLFTIWSANLSLAANNPNFIHTNAESPLAILADFYKLMNDYNSWAPSFSPASSAHSAVHYDANIITNITQDMSL